MSFTIDTWCAEHGLSRSTYYQLRKIGKAPRIFEVTPGCPRISAEANRQWVAEREAETRKAAEAEGV